MGKLLVFNEIKSYEEALDAFEQVRLHKSEDSNLDAIIINALGDTLKGLKRNEDAKEVYDVASKRGYKAGKTFFDEFLIWPPSTEYI